MILSKHLTLARAVLGSFIGLLILLGILFAAVFEESRKSVLESSRRLQAEDSGEIAENVRAYLSSAERVIHAFEEQIQQGVVRPGNVPSVEHSLFALLLADDALTELTLTEGKKIGETPEGAIRLAEEGKSQVAVYRLPAPAQAPGLEPGGNDRLFVTRILTLEKGGFVSRIRDETGHGGFLSGATQTIRYPAPRDPTLHMTFLTPSHRDFSGKILWSDWHWMEMDEHLPPQRRRVIVTTQKAIADREGRFVGVFRAGLLTDRIEALINHEEKDRTSHEIFLCDTQGRMISRMTHQDRLEEMGDDLRVNPDRLTGPVRRALQLRVLREVSESNPVVFEGYSENGRKYMVTYRYLEKNQDWVLGILVPESYYFGELQRIRNNLLLLLGVLIVSIFFIGLMILHHLGKTGSSLCHEAGRMNSFHFEPSPIQSPFHDVREVLESLERAKAAMRSLGKYAPLALVKELYLRQQDPVPGGDPNEVSILFTDIRDFTSYSETLSPQKLAEALGLYLEVMERVIQKQCGGVIDKYIGDAVMALWNVPSPLADHPARACQAMLECRRVCRELFGSPEWARTGAPAFQTRFGLHCGTVLVGHFGSPDRLNYTALGDGVNLAARLESINKVYGTEMIVSESVVERVGQRFEFRLLDCVTVKGKTRPVRIFELLGETGTLTPSTRDICQSYEEAFELYLAGDFQGCLTRCQTLTGDPPSQRLAGRCRQFILNPPDSGWDGTHVFTEK
ncbi:MAG: adenylate/guanylate cyclase domain-containing protein [Verrucomicrobiae bacterium]|nr:adenylate/guanylate cyclase domain-containing protein [Verrucomicrobiae bacterium]